MTLLGLRFVPHAIEQLLAAERWWRENRDKAPDLFTSEVEESLELLRRTPDVGAAYSNQNLPDVQRFLLRRHPFRGNLAARGMNESHRLRLAHLELVALGLSLSLLPTTVIAQPQTRGVIVDGQVTVRAVHVRLECERSPGSVHCDVEQQFELEAEGADGRVSGSDLDGLRLSLDGEESTEGLLPAGRRVLVEVRYTVGQGGGWPVLVPALSLRHPVLAESWRFYGARDSLHVEMPSGEGLRLDGDVVYEAGGVDDLTVSVGAEVIRGWPHRAAAWSDVHVELRHDPEPVANGGPVLVVGGQLRTDMPGGAPLLGVGYELGLLEHLVLSLWFETNFEAIAQALLLEWVSPGLFILPSVGAGVGFVATQLGARGVDAAMRLRLTVSSWAVGFIADSDYYPSTGSWNIGLAGRIGI